MSSSLRVALAQIDLFVGDVEGNTRKILEYTAEARDRLKADLVMFPELAICGYPPEDLLFHAGLRRQVERAVATLCEQTRGIAVLIGYPEYADGGIYNAAALIADGAIIANYRKQLLPNYRVFDEKRYFRAGSTPTVVDLNGVRCALLVCEDVWEPGPARQAAEAGAELALVINGSPYSVRYQDRRESVVQDRVVDTGCPVVYVNLVGGQDELVFDGGSFAMSSAGEIVQRLEPFVEKLELVEVARAKNGRVEPVAGNVAPIQPVEQSVYNALVLGVRDYVNKHHFPGIVMGLSGGIDSALTLAIAVDALGNDRVHAVMMPSRYTADMSIADAAEQARILGVRHDVISIEGMFEATLDALSDVFEGTKPDTTEENIQSRCRGVLLMAISNKTGRMVLTTGNKSEMAVGYATLYGDMAGGFAPIKDCSKLLVYRLARYRNSISPVIPERVIVRPPSAELRPDQKDTDSLPPYEILDPILEAFIEEDLSVDEIADRGFDRETVGRVLELVKRNEYKRRQAPPGVRISSRAFGRDWRYPITSGYRAR
ncbi:MAG TPA: NAD+ synthase [Steroidobacteraceae bacterium]|nr:NAD+ synthase [Steroidobacteraceae bacterium]